MQENQQVSVEQTVIRGLGARVGGLTADVEILSAQLQVMQQQNADKDNRIHQLEQELEATRVPVSSGEKGVVANG